MPAPLKEYMEKVGYYSEEQMTEEDWAIVARMLNERKKK